MAGSGADGVADGQGTVASFYRPTGVCLDASGNMYVADHGNNSIRKIETFKIGKDSPFYPAKLSNIVILDTTNNFKRGRNITSNCTTAIADTNVIDAFYTFVATSDSASVVLNVANSAWVSALELIDNLNFTSISNQCKNTSITGTQRNYTFKNLVIGQTYLLRVELGNTSPLGYARAEGVNNTFSMQLKSILTGLESYNSSSNLTIYPNPAQNLLHLQLNESIQGTVCITDLQGQTILSIAINDNYAQINTSHVANGVYILKVVSEKANYTKQVIISR